MSQTDGSPLMHQKGKSKMAEHKETGIEINGWKVVREYGESQRRYFRHTSHYKLINTKTGKYYRHPSGRKFWALTLEHAEETARNI